MTTSNTTPSTQRAVAKRRGRQPAFQTEPGAPPSCLHHLDDRTRRTVERAVKMLEESAIYRVEAMKSPSDVRDYLRLKLSHLEHEEFHAIWLDAQNRMIAFERISSGTLTQTSVYPREVVKAALSHNAAAVIFAHNHPSGENKPSAADTCLTASLKSALAMVDIRVLDHFIVAGVATPFSFAERGLI